MPQIRLFFPEPPYILLSFHTQHENIFLTFFCHSHRVAFGLCNPNTHLKKDFRIT